MDVQEVRKLDAYLKRLYANARLRVVPAAPGTASVFIGEERLGGISVDDEDDEHSYNFEIKITMGEPADAKDIKKLEAFLRRKFDNERIRVVPRIKKTDSAEVFIGDEYIGILFFDDKEAKSAYFEMAILELDLE